MEIGLDVEVPTYAGGLGILAGDTVRSAADLRVPLVAVTLLHRRGYFTQKLDASGKQTEAPAEWNVAEHLAEQEPRVRLTLEGRTVALRAWLYSVQGLDGHAVPVYFLDSDLPENSEWDRGLTGSLYGGDPRYRLCQETLLGIGGVRMLRALGYHNIERFHLNEGHSSLLTVELLRERVSADHRTTVQQEDLEAIRNLCVFTTHTPVPAGHDQFPLPLVLRVLGLAPVQDMRAVLLYEGSLNLTYLALKLSRYVNGVAKKHGQVSRQMFGGYEIDSITNGVHVATWTSPPFQELFDRYIPGWRRDNFSLRYALSIPLPAVWEAHRQAKQALVEQVGESGEELDPNTFTIGFARRVTQYKRPDLLFRNLERLRTLSDSVGPIQIVYAGKAHPRDQIGKELIERIFRMRDALKGSIRLVYLPNYDMRLGKLVTSGVDLWLNTPQPPLEASGTSGMKAALNGVPSLSLLDGWWIEGHIEGVTGWAIGEGSRYETGDGEGDAAALYDKLEKIILPLFYQQRDNFITVMRSAIALNGSFFNTERMVQEYVLKAYFR
jgi:starch phosphorylase